MTSFDFWSAFALMLLSLLLGLSSLVIGGKIKDKATQNIGLISILLGVGYFLLTIGVVKW